jgi:hypothetical protein
MAAVDLLTHEGFGMSDEEDSASEWEPQPDGQQDDIANSNSAL